MHWTLLPIHPKLLHIKPQEFQSQLLYQYMRKCKYKMLAYKYKNDSFFKSLGENRLSFCLPVFSFGIRHLCSASFPYSLNLPITSVSLIPAATKAQFPGDVGHYESHIYCILKDCIRDKIMKHLIHSFGNANVHCYVELLLLGNLEIFKNQALGFMFNNYDALFHVISHPLPRGHCNFTFTRKHSRWYHDNNKWTVL